MSDQRKTRAFRNFNPVEAIVDSLRDHTLQVENYTRAIERHKARIFFVGYLLISFFLLSVTLGVYIWGKVDKDDALLAGGMSAFLITSIVGLPLTALGGLKRYAHYKGDLKRAVISLVQAMRLASQIVEHAELDNFESVLLKMRLSEAEAAMKYAASFVQKDFDSVI